MTISYYVVIATIIYNPQGKLDGINAALLCVSLTPQVTLNVGRQKDE
jgi:hypothetical protein